mgnify:CR=1 FL=1|jgi:hypothetical protein
MGYCMSLRNSKFFLPAQRMQEAFAALTNLSAQAPKQRHGHFAWVRTEVLAQARDVRDVLNEWRWRPTFSTQGDIVDLSFEGEKLGDDKQLFDALAPYVSRGSFLEMHGEDGEVWRWVFDGVRCLEQSANVGFPDLPGGDVIDVEAREVTQPPLLR